MSKKVKVKVPDSVFELRWDLNKYGKKHNIRTKGKGMGKKRKREAKKKLIRSYSESAIVNLNKAVKILSENPDGGKKIMKVREAVENIIHNHEVMSKIAKIYSKDPKPYPNMIFLPYMITNTITFYKNSEGLSDEDKEYANKLDVEGLITFCGKILKRQIRHYRKAGLEDNIAFEMANVIPTAKLLLNGRDWYKALLRKLYAVAEFSSIPLDVVLPAIRSIDKKKQISKEDFLCGFYSEFIFQKSSNKALSYNDTQKELHDNLIVDSLVYLDGLKEKKLRDVLKTYIKRRKSAESYKNDSRRVIRFIDHANANSSYTKLKTVIQDLIADNSSNELYLS